MYSRSGSSEYSSGSSSSGSGRVYNVGGSSGSEPGSTSWGDSSGSGSRSDSSESSSRFSSSSVAGPPVPVDPSTPPRRYRRSTDVIPLSPEEDYPEPPEIDPEFLAIWYQENYFKADAHDRAQIQLQELVAKYVHGYRADEVLPLETLISVLDAYIEEQNARLNELDVDVEEPPSSGVPGSTPSGRKRAFFVIEQQKKQLRKANDEIHQLRDHIAHLDEELTNAINIQGGLPGPSTSAPRQMDEQEQNLHDLQQNLESKKAAISRLTDEHEYLQAQLDELNEYIQGAREYIQTQDVEVERLKEEIGGIHVYADQLRQQVEGEAPRFGATFSQPGSPAPVNRTFEGPLQPHLAASSPVGQNQIPQLPLPQISPVGQNRLPRPGTRSPRRMSSPPSSKETKDATYLSPSRNQASPRIRKSTVSSMEDSIQSRHDSLYSPGMDRTYSGAERDDSYETSYEGTYPDYYLSGLSSLDIDASLISDVFILPDEPLEGDVLQAHLQHQLQEEYRRANRRTYPPRLRPKIGEDYLYGRSIGRLDSTYDSNFSYGDEDLLLTEPPMNLNNAVNISPQSPGISPRSPHNASFQKTVMLQSPSRETPLFLDIDVQTRPIIETASGEHVVCDISLDMIEPGKRPLSHRSPPIMESKKIPDLQTPRGVSRKDRYAVNPLWGRYSPGRPGTSTEPPQTIQREPPQFNRTFDVPPRMNRTVEVPPRINRTF